MPTLTREHKRFIVERLALFDDPSEVADLVIAEFGVKVTRQQVWTYDPTKPSNDGRIAEELRALFKATRERFLADAAERALTHKPYRLAQLEGLYRDAKKRKNIPLAAQLLEQAAKEVGGMFTNTRILKTGDPLAELSKLLGVPAEQIAAAVSGTTEDDDGAGADAG